MDLDLHTYEEMEEFISGCVYVVYVAHPNALPRLST